MNPAEDFWLLKVTRRQISMAKVDLVDMVDMVYNIDMVDNMDMVNNVMWTLWTA